MSGAALPEAIRRFASRLKFPQLFVLVGVLLLADLLIVDPIPFLDEIILALLALLFGTWKDRESSPEQARDVTPEPQAGQIDPPSGAASERSP